jgi:hypothetical protein
LRKTVGSVDEFTKEQPVRIAARKRQVVERWFTDVAA